MKLNDVLITQVLEVSASGETGSETVSLNFGKVHFEYKPQKEDGSLDAAVFFKYDLKTNKEG